MPKRKTPPTVTTALRQAFDALETCRVMADSNNDGISYKAADEALTVLAEVLPDGKGGIADVKMDAFDTQPNWKQVIDNVLSYHKQGFYDDATALSKLRRAVDAMSDSKDTVSPTKSI